MASQKGSAHAHLSKADLDLFHHSLVTACRAASPLMSSLERLLTFFDQINSPVAFKEIAQAMSREVRRCKTDFESAETCYQSCKDTSATLIDTGNFPEALTAMSEGNCAIITLVIKLDKLTNRLHNFPTKVKKIKLSPELETLCFDEEMEAWSRSLLALREETAYGPWQGYRPSA